MVDSPPNHDAPRADDAAMHLSGLYVYPIKSMGGIPLEAWDVDGRGLRYDRRWMLVDEDSWFISQRELPRMARISVRIKADRVVVNAPHMPALELPLGATTGKTVPARIWDDVVEASPVGDDADRWFGEFLGVRCRLVFLPDESVRPVDPDYGEAGDQVGLADGFPFLLISEASLADLNARLERPLPMNRFRRAHRSHNLPRRQALLALRHHHRRSGARRHGQGTPAYPGQIPQGGEQSPVRAELDPRRNGHPAHGRPRGDRANPVIIH